MSTDMLKTPDELADEMYNEEDDFDNYNEGDRHGNYDYQYEEFDYEEEDYIDYDYDEINIDSEEDV